MGIFSNVHDLGSIKEHLSSVDKIKGNLSHPNSYNDLTTNAQKLKDIGEMYAYDCKGAVHNLNKVLVKAGISTLDLFESQQIAFDQTDVIKNRLESRLQEVATKPKEPLKYFIEDIGIDFLFNPTPSYTTNTVTQSIVSKEVPDILSEDAQNQNMYLSADLIFSGTDMNSKYKSLLKLRDTKKLVKCVFDEVYESMIITSITPSKDGTQNQLSLNISFEQIFVSTLKITDKPLKAFKKPLNKPKAKGKTGTKKSKVDFKPYAGINTSNKTIQTEF